MKTPVSNTYRKYIVAAAMVAILGVFAPAAQAQSTAAAGPWCNYGTTDNKLSEVDTVKKGGETVLEEILRTYRLSAPFTSSEYGAAVAEALIRSLRLEFKLPPKFTSNDLKQHAGAKLVA